MSTSVFQVAPDQGDLQEEQKYKMERNGIDSWSQLYIFDRLEKEEFLHDLTTDFVLSW